MAATITALETSDVRFPTSRELDGSDAMNVDPDYSAAYVVLRTDAPDGLEGHGFAFTIGRGNEVQVAAIDALAPLVVGLELERGARRHRARFSRHLTGDSQLRWLGPEKGVIHMAAAAVVNAVWDLCAKREGKPLWKLLARHDPRADRRRSSTSATSTDALTPDEALALLREREPGRAERERALLERRAARPTRPRRAGSATPTRSCAGCSPRRSPTASRTSSSRSGADVEDDVRRCAIAREALGARPRS